MSADQAHAQVDPGIARFDAVLAHMLVRLSNFDLVKMSTFLRHGILLVF